MKTLLHFLSLRKNYDAFLFAITGWGIIFLFTRHGGVGLSPDSIVYGMTAKHLFMNGSLKGCNAMPMTDFPAGYPIFLSIILFITRESPFLFGAILNAFLFGTVIYISGCIIQRFITPSRLYKNILLFCILCSHTMIEVYYMLWSETLFILLLLLFFIALKNYLKIHTLLPLIIAAFVVSLACITRYAGISLLGTGCMILFFDKKLDWKKKTFHISVFFLVAIALLSINLLHNYTGSGFLTGNREKGITPLIENIKNCGIILCDWLPFFNGNYSMASIVAILVFIIAAILFTRNFFTNIYYYSFENIAICFFIVYSVFIVASATITHYETLNGRLLSPLYISFLCISYPLVSFIKRVKKPVKRGLIAGVIVLAFFFIYNEVSQTQDLYEDASENGIPGFTADDWIKAPMDIYLKEHKNIFTSSFLYSNSIEAVCFFTGNSCDALPHYVFKQEIKNYNDEEPHYLIWFNNIDNAGLFHLPDISQYKKIKLIKSFSDGSIYWCDKK